jgi:PhnB protein
MKQFDPYLIFSGNCREAFSVYAKHLDAELSITNYPDSELVMHARISKGRLALMASDCPPDQSVAVGQNFFVSVDCESKEEASRLFERFAEHGKILQPIGDTFWNAWFGMLVDRFGIQWMFSYTYGS